MSYKKDLSYRSIPFSSETPEEDFYIHDAISRLHAKCEINKHRIIKIRTVGILTNNHGCFYIKQMFATHDTSVPPDPRKSIQISMVYINKYVKCLSMPYPVQLFGMLQWCSRPVIFAQIIQPLKVSVATVLHETLVRVSTLQSCRYQSDTQELDHS